MPKKKYDFDVIVIGSGPGGSSVAMKCAKGGLKVAVIDRLFGGTCALRGCTPKKAMESVTSAWWQAKDFDRCGFPSMPAPIDWKELMAHKAKFTAHVPHGTKQKFESKGIAVIEGEAVFEDEHSLKVGEESYSAEKIVIAVGAKPFPLDFEGAEYLTTSADFFELDELPAKIVFIGGGYIGFELSHIVAACGAKVVILSMEENPLASFDNELIDSLVQATLKKGIDVRLGFEAQKIEQKEKGFSVKAKRNGSGKIYDFDADLVIHSAGRIPAIETLAISKIDLSTNDGGGIEVNEDLQTSKHVHVFAIGDVTGKLPFTEIAGYEGGIVAHNILHPKDLKSTDYTGTPSAVFTHPKLASVGKNEADLKEEGIEYEVFSDSFSGSFLQRTHKNEFARYKTIVDKKSGKILGANVLGHGAEDIINIFAICIQAEITSQQLSNMLLAYPTASRQAKHFF